jgi:hypothetical protein
MRTKEAFVVLALVLVAPPCLAQPKDGDLIVTLRYPTFANTGGFTLSVDPRKGTYTTLVQPNSKLVHEWVRMAPDNRDVVIGATDSNAMNGGYMVEVDPSGQQSLLTADGVLGVGGFELDHDDHWIIAGIAIRSTPPKFSALWSLDHTNRTLNTLFMSQGAGEFKDVAIHREPGSAPYMIGVFQNGSSSLASPKLMAADRTGVISTLVSGNQGQKDPLNYLQGVELDPFSGDFFVTDTTPPALTLVNATSGALNPLTTANLTPSGAKLAADGTAWMVGLDAKSQPAVFRFDMQGTMITMFQLQGLPFQPVFPTSVDVYGSRRLVCRGSGQPGTQMTINLQSRRAGDGNMPYAIALSFGRRPGLQFPNGDRLNLALDPLFFMSLANTVPGLFVNFQGQTDASGNATARVNIPGAFPPNLGITIYAAGALLHPAGPWTVSNTHWFVLS